MYKCSAVEQSVSKQQNVHCQLLSPSRSTFVLESDIKTGGCTHPLSTVHLMYKKVRARKQNFKQQNEILSYQLSL